MTTLSPTAGVTRLRAFQLGLETTPLTQHAATRRMPWSFAPDVNPNWTDVTSDTGTLDPAVAPYRTAYDVTGTSTGQLFANDTATLISAGVMGGLSFTGGGTAKTLTAAPASTTQDVFDTWTGEWYDDATADAFAGTGGLVDSMSFTYPQNLGPIEHSANWRFANAVYPATPTAALLVDAAPIPLFAADTVVSIDSTAGGIGVTPFTNQVYDIAITLSNNLDPKRFQNGSNTRFQIAGYSRGARTMTVAITFAKATAAIAEVVAWLGASPTERFLQISTASPSLAQAAVPYSLRWRIPGFWFTRSDQTVNSNTAFQLLAHGIYDATLTYPFQVVAVGTRTSL